MRKEGAMENKVVVLPEAVGELSHSTNTSEILCETFLKEFFALIAEQLEKGHTVCVKKIGTFAVVGGGVTFHPADEITEAVNAAFDCFEPIELDDDYQDEPEDEDAELQPVDKPIAEDAADLQPEEHEEQPETTPIEEEILEMQGDETCPMPDADAGIQQQEAVSSETELPIENMAENDAPQSVEKRSCAIRFWWGYIAGFLTVAAIAAASYFSGMVDVRLKIEESIMPQKAESVAEVLADTTIAVETSICEPEDSVGNFKEDKRSEVVGNPQKEQLFKVTKTAYLSNISRKFYGHYVFWIYIYLENKDVIKNPDNLPIGAMLRIPSPEKYGIDKTNPNSIKQAELKALEVTGK